MADCLSELKKKTCWAPINQVQIEGKEVNETGNIIQVQMEEKKAGRTW